MKKILLILFMFILTGCSVVRIKTDSIENILKVILTKDNNLYNQIGEGYKYYVPGGVTYIDSDESNDILYSNGVYYYLYIDAIDYYYDNDVKYNTDSSKYYSYELKKSDGYKYSGYLDIVKQGKLYLINFVYNHAKIEALVNENEINNTILNASYILSTIKYNRNITKLIIEDDSFTNKTGKYRDYISKDNGGKFVLEKENEMKEDR